VKLCTLHADAEAELVKALEYYEGKRAGLGRQFRLEFEAALGRIRQDPQLYAAEDELGVRHCPLHRFPYTVVYLDLGDYIWVAAVAHQP
jgi:toxin ParE1/3/4